MARILDRRRAIKLREQGKSWTEIKNTIPASRDTLARWLKDASLTDVQKQSIFQNAKAKRIENYIIATKAKRKRIEAESYKEESDKLGIITKRDLLIAGMFLYLGEGAKSTRSKIQVTNSDPDVIKFSIAWMVKSLGIPKSNLKIQLHLYVDMDIEKEIRFWQNITGLKKNNFIKPYIKKTSSLRIDHPSFGHGTCSVYYHNVNIKNKFIAGIRVIMNAGMGV